jgi:cytochrome c-type biogenesis protein CcmH/NrfG
VTDEEVYEDSVQELEEKETMGLLETEQRLESMTELQDNILEARATLEVYKCLKIVDGTEPPGAVVFFDQISSIFFHIFRHFSS